MRDFINAVTLLESKSAPLYHGTNLLFLAAIIATDHLGAGGLWGRKGEPHGPRLTRNYRVAMTFARDNEFGMGGVVVLDQRKLSHNHRIQPYADVNMHGERWSNEFEEVPLAPNGIDRMSRYLLSVNAEPYEIAQVLEDEEAMGYGVMESGMPAVRAFETFDECRTALTNLLHHPKLNAVVPYGRWTDEWGWRA